MRVRTLVAIVSLLLPAEAGAQRFPLPGAGRQGPMQPVPLSPTPASIAREISYRRLPISVESYPLISYVQAPGLAGTSSWTSLGGGVRAEYRLTHLASATLDLTSSFAGSPMVVQTAEIGTRLGPERSARSEDTERRLYPFVDVRVGYISAYNGGLASIAVDPLGGSPTQGVYGSRYSNGFGGVAGAGMEYAITRSFTLTTAGTVMRSHLTSRDFANPQAVVPSFAMTSVRYTIGIKYNPVRMVLPAGTDLR